MYQHLVIMLYICRIQVYPEALDAEKRTEKEKEAASPQDKMRRDIFGDFWFADLEQQPSPRLFSTHLFGSSWLPQQRVDPHGQGKLIIVLRNLKDTLASLHFTSSEERLEMAAWRGLLILTARMLMDLIFI